MNFKRLTLADRETLNAYYYANKCRGCDCTFADIFCWRDMFSTQWTECEGFLVVKFHYKSEDRNYYMMPLAMDPEADFTPILPLLVEDAAQDGTPMWLTGLNRRGEELVKKAMPGEFMFDTDRSDQDYIYLAEDLRNLRGEKYASKRNHIHRFTSAYQYEYRPLTRDYFTECMRLENEWCRRRGGRSDELEMEHGAMRIAFDNFEELGLVGGTLWCEGRLIAFTYGSAVCDEVFCTHVEKADTDYEGAFTMINKLFAEHLPSGFKYINREEDMGIEGLRRAKMSYHPVELCENACALRLDGRMRAMKHIWKECFGDEDSFIDSFLVRFYSPSAAFVHEECGEVVSMAFVVPFESAFGRTAYIYAVATLEKYRRRGYAEEVVRGAVEWCRSAGYDVAVLIPQGDGLVRYYERMGFENLALPVKFEGDFDFGTGFPEADKAMVMPLKEDNTMPAAVEELVCTPMW